MTTRIIFSHTYFEKSQANRALLNSLKNAPNVALTNLEERYPDGKIDIPREHADLESADKIVWQFPLFWYAPPALLKAWQDEVLTPIYGQKNSPISNKKVGMVITIGGTENDYKAWDTPTESAMQRILLPLFLTIDGVNAIAQKPLLFYGAVGSESVDAAAYLDYLKNL